jgi:hypothetical protein
MLSCTDTRYIHEKRFETLRQDLHACVGQDVAVSDWLTITQAQMNLFAQTPPMTTSGYTPTTEARQSRPVWQHDCHGFLTLSLLPPVFAVALLISQTPHGH